MIRCIIEKIIPQKNSEFFNSPKSYLYPIVHFLLLALPASFIAYYYHQYNLYPDYDAAFYFDVSDKLYQIYLKDGFLSYIKGLYSLRTWVPTLFPALGSIFLIITGGKYIGALSLMHSALYILFTHFTHLLIKELHEKKTASLLGTYALVTLPFIYEVSFEYMSELPFITFAMGALYFFTLLWDRKKTSAYAGFTICLSLAILIRPSLTMLVFFIPLLSWSIVTWKKITLEFIQLLFISIVAGVTLFTYDSLIKAGSINCCIQWEIRCIEPDALSTIAVSLFFLSGAPLLFKVIVSLLKIRYQFMTDLNLKKSIWIIYSISILWYLPHLDKLSYWAINLSYGFHNPHGHQIIPLSKDFHLLCSRELIFIVFSFFLLNLLIYLPQKKQKKRADELRIGSVKNKQTIGIYFIFLSSFLLLHSTTNYDMRYALFPVFLLFTFLFISILRIGSDSLHLKKIFFLTIITFNIIATCSFFSPKTFMKYNLFAAYGLAPEFDLSMYLLHNIGYDPKIEIINFISISIPTKKASFSIKREGLIQHDTHIKEFLSAPNTLKFIAHNNKHDWDFFDNGAGTKGDYTLVLSDNALDIDDNLISKKIFFNPNQSFQIFCYLYKN